MSRATYDDILAQLCPKDEELVSLDQVHRLARQLHHPAVWYDTLGSIYNQQAQAHIKEADGRMKKQMARWVREYNSGAEMLAIAERHGFSPCNLARQLLLKLLETSGAKDVTPFIRDPSLLEGLGQRLAANVAACVAADHFNSPRADLIKRTMGLEYEVGSCLGLRLLLVSISWRTRVCLVGRRDPPGSAHVSSCRFGIQPQYILEERLRNAGLAFQTEEGLRDEGNAVTPDVKLAVPISIAGHTVHWIDSKVDATSRSRACSLDRFVGIMFMCTE